MAPDQQPHAGTDGRLHNRSRPKAPPPVCLYYALGERRGTESRNESGAGVECTDEVGARPVCGLEEQRVDGDGDRRPAEAVHDVAGRVHVQGAGACEHPLSSRRENHPTCIQVEAVHDMEELEGQQVREDQAEVDHDENGRGEAVAAELGRDVGLEVGGEAVLERVAHPEKPCAAGQLTENMTDDE